VYNIHTGKVLKTLRHTGYISERHPCPAAVFAAPEPASTSSGGLGLDGNTNTESVHHADAEGTAEKDKDKDTPMDVDADADADADVKDVGVGVGVGVGVDVNGVGVDGVPVAKRREAWVVSGSENGKVVIWELGSRRVIQVLEGTGAEAHQRPVVALAVHPDGRSIATGSLEPEKVIHIWRDV
jgi:COMPASS component SWD3